MQAQIIKHASKPVWRTKSRVVTPNRRFGSYTPLAFSTAAAMGTVELTGFEMMFRIACTQRASISQRGARLCFYTQVHATVLSLPANMAAPYECARSNALTAHSSSPRSPPAWLHTCTGVIRKSMVPEAIAQPLRLRFWEQGLRQPTHLGAVLRDARDERAHDAGVDVEQVVARHTRLARHAGRDDHQVGALERACQLRVPGVPLRRAAGLNLNLTLTRRPRWSPGRRP